MLYTIKQYAESQKVTYEAVRKQINRYKKDLDGQIIKKGRTQYLTDEAVAFLSEHRHASPAIVYRQEKQSEQEAQKIELEDLRTKYALVLEKLASIQEENAREKIALNAKIEMLYQKQIELLEAPKKKRKWFWQR